MEEYDVPNGLLGMKRDVILRLSCFLIIDEIREYMGSCQEICRYRNHPYFHNFPIMMSVQAFDTLYKHIIYHVVFKKNNGSIGFKEKLYFIPRKHAAISPPLGKAQDLS
jgi:hypothetical protein